MQLEFKDCEKQVTKEQILKIEHELKIKLPHEFIEHYVKWNGGYPNKSLFYNENVDFDEIEIKDFIPFLYAHDFQDDPDFTLEGRVVSEWQNNEIPQYFLPFGLDWGGNYFCLNLNNQNIYYFTRDYWDENLSNDENFQKNSTKISNSFNEFLQCLQENPDDDRTLD
ncbi:SMI1/KNR4 family protein [Neisseria animaloris]|uniref:SMI1/KNR4 family protein n=1 Tax=Neisseria animaloris TaxID=326522 RepID=UPI000D321290|nr:SMI1/KNR4 family protein [Neisseria animaloris]